MVSSLLLDLEMVWGKEKRENNKYLVLYKEISLSLSWKQSQKLLCISLRFYVKDIYICVCVCVCVESELAKG